MLLIRFFAMRWLWLLVVLGAMAGCVSSGRVVVDWDLCIAVQGEVCEVSKDN